MFINELGKPVSAPRLLRVQSSVRLPDCPVHPRREADIAGIVLAGHDPAGQVTAFRAVADAGKLQEGRACIDMKAFTRTAVQHFDRFAFCKHVVAGDRGLAGVGIDKPDFGRGDDDAGFEQGFVQPVRRLQQGHHVVVIRTEHFGFERVACQRGGLQVGHVGFTALAEQ